MSAQPQDDRVRIDATGTAHPIGREASRLMRAAAGNARLLPAPEGTLVLRDQVAGDAESGRPWMVGEVGSAGALWDLIGMVAQANWTGELCVIDSAERSIVFDRGSVIAARSKHEDERLGEVMYQYGAIDQEELKMVLQHVAPDLRFGEACVWLGLLSRERLFELIATQAKEIVYSVMRVDRGSFSFTAGYDELAQPYHLNLPVSPLLMEGVQRMDEMSCFRARIPSDLHVPKPLPGRVLGEGHVHAHVYAKCNGERSIEDLGRELELGIFEVSRAVFQLVQQGHCEIVAPHPTSAEAMVELFNQALAILHQAVDAAGQLDSLREQLGSYATSGGIYDPLFLGAGPMADGTFDGERVADNFALVSGTSTLTTLGQWLHDYAAFAAFAAEALLRTSAGSSPSASDSSRRSAAVSSQVVRLIEPLAVQSTRHL